MTELTHRAHSVGQNAFHFVWKPKYASSFLRFNEVNQVCVGALRLVALRNNCQVYELMVMPDHIHLFVEVPPTMCVSKALQLFKGISSRILRRRFKFLTKIPMIWSKGKFFRSVGNVNFETIQHYIAQSQGEWKFAKT
ncbi:MAG: IS200/IS605 family transposase [Candidatus Aenigmatarchaeota archaeon]|nr:MAG: IS200/IS605 family transposase [Candidatus Aenigmarchaeota archaeon]